MVEIKLFTQDFFSKPAVQDIVADLSDLVVGVRSKHRGDRLMATLEHYRQIIKQTLSRQAEFSPSHGQIETIPVFDEQTDNYRVVDVGWDQPGRVHAVILHLALRNGKVWIEVDGIEEGITQELLAAGIPKQDIVLAFYRPERRKLTEFAVA